MNALDHWADSFSSDGDQYECDDCSDVFSEEGDLRYHEQQYHYYCDPCNRYFSNWNNLNQCPFCKQTRATATGLIHHLEQGGCPNAPLNREKLYEAVRRRDPNGVISKKLLTWQGSTTRCGKEFTLLAAVINHLESESCKFMRFDAVQQNVERIIDPGRMISF
ncbi:hypothetical protein Brms1b_006283 [Colletotrichum noveboracense]|nr:hypothetical protein Brms1b_006283 [Colletotrichum noveboracense]